MFRVYQAQALQMLALYGYCGLGVRQLQVLDSSKYPGRPVQVHLSSPPATVGADIILWHQCLSVHVQSYISAQSYTWNLMLLACHEIAVLRHACMVEMANQIHMRPVTHAWTAG